MAYSALNGIIDQYVYTNGQGQITGGNLNTTLKAMVASLGEGYLFMGVAAPSDNPSSPDQKCFWVAVEGGTYSNFGGVTVHDGITVLAWNGTAFSMYELLRTDNIGGAASKGIFASATALSTAYPDPAVGWYAYVGTTSPYAIYNCTTAGEWTDSGDTITFSADLGNVAFLADI